MSLSILQRAIEIAGKNDGVVCLKFSIGQDVITTLLSESVHVSDKNTWKMLRPMVFAVQPGPEGNVGFAPWEFSQESVDNVPVEPDIAAMVIMAYTPMQNVRAAYLQVSGQRKLAVPAEKKILLG